MNEKEGNKILNQGDDKVHIYENDDAYLLGEEISGDGSLEVGYKSSFKENEKKIKSQKELLNKFKTNLSQDDELEENQNEELNEKNNNNINNENIIYNQTKNINSSLQENKYIINDINSDENEEGGENEEEENNQENENLNFGENINENEKTNDNYIIDNTKINKNLNNNIDIKNNNNEKEIDNNENQNEENDEVENDSNDSGVPLVTLNFLSICQCCKNSFNSKENIPYLFKCGHFFCKQCIEEQFTDEEGIKCPNDGLVGKYLSELKILNNFITDKPPTQRTKSNKKYCEYHKGQNLTHYIEDTKELICVYCAFERYKSNPNVEIKEISEKCKSMENIIEGIIDDNQNNVEIIQNSLLDIKKNKENEEKKIDEVFNGLFEILKIKRDELLTQIEKIFTDNAKKLSEKLEIFSNKLERGEKIKSQILLFENNQEEINFSQIMGIYDTFIKEINDINKITLQKYKFIYNDEIALRGILNNFCSLELKEKNCNFLGNISPINIKEDIINNINNSNNILYKQPFIKVNKEISNLNNMQNIQNNNNNKNNSYNEKKKKNKKTKKND